MFQQPGAFDTRPVCGSKPAHKKRHSLSCCMNDPPEFPPGYETKAAEAQGLIRRRPKRPRLSARDRAAESVDPLIVRSNIRSCMVSCDTTNPRNNRNQASIQRACQTIVGFNDDINSLSCGGIQPLNAHHEASWEAGQFDPIRLLSCLH
ncbi:MAG: hypothetical protein ACI89J_001785 [Hyphomicrobiaceae bacterium]|jgi:hypothetical protein